MHITQPVHDFSMHDVTMESAEESGRLVFDEEVKEVGEVSSIAAIPASVCPGPALDGSGPRTVYRQACSRCRADRAKCDGGRPCGRCQTREMAQSCTDQSGCSSKSETPKQEMKRTTRTRMCASPNAAGSPATRPTLSSSSSHRCPRLRRSPNTKKDKKKELQSDQSEEDEQAEAVEEEGRGSHGTVPLALAASPLTAKRCREEDDTRDEGEGSAKRLKPSVKLEPQTSEAGGEGSQAPSSQRGGGGSSGASSSGGGDGRGEDRQTHCKHLFEAGLLCPGPPPLHARVLCAARY